MVADNNNENVGFYFVDVLERKQSVQHGDTVTTLPHSRPMQKKNSVKDYETYLL